jgi:transposase-like protein
MGEKRKSYKRQDRLRLLSEYAGSGLSAEEFCEREGIVKNSLYRWRKQEGSPALSQANFIQLAPDKPDEWSIELELSSGAVLRFK